MIGAERAGYRPPVEPPKIDHRGELPPHRQIAGWLLARIEVGELAAGQPLPSETELVQTFGVARTTVRRAIAHLREVGAVYTVAGRGSYVSPR
jgi:GntR family transcriptional regulator